MTRYVLRRLLALVPSLFGVSGLIFTLMRLVPGDPARVVLGAEATGEQVAILWRQWGLDEPLPVQYLLWVQHALQGDFGPLIVSRVPASQEIFSRLPSTLQLTSASMVVSIVVGSASASWPPCGTTRSSTA